MLELYWSPSCEKIRSHENVYSVTSQFMESTWCTKQNPFRHPFIELSSHKLWMYVDRQNLRFPESVLEEVNKRGEEQVNKKKETFKKERKGNKRLKNEVK